MSGVGEPCLPVIAEISLKRYQKTYSSFLNWRKERNVSTLGEKSLLAYFNELRSKYSPTYLYSIYSMLKSMLSFHDNIDLSKYGKLLTFLRQNSEGYTVKKSKTFSRSEINSFVNEASDEVYLLIKVGAIFGVMGACRCHEMHSLLFEQVKDTNESLLVNITKKKRIDHTFTVAGKFYEIVKKYMNLRPDGCTNKYFFLNYYKGRCSSNLRVGINTFGSMGKRIANFLCLENPELYTGHCFWRTSNDLLTKAGTGGENELLVERVSEDRDDDDENEKWQPPLSSKSMAFLNSWDISDNSGTYVVFINL